MSQLKHISSDLEQSFGQLKDVCKRLQGKTSADDKKLRGLLQLISGQMADLKDASEDVEIAIKARDDTISALGEKLSQQHEKSSKPFFVAPKEAPCQGGVFKPEEMGKWDKKRRVTHTNNMLRELARLSILPMGLEGKEQEETLEQVLAQMQHAHQLPSEEEAERERESKIRKRAINLIEVSESNDVARSKTREFLRSKGLSNDKIDKYFSLYDSKRAAALDCKRSPRERLMRQASDDFERAESCDTVASEDSSIHYDLVLSSGSSLSLQRTNSAVAC